MVKNSYKLSAEAKKAKPAAKKVVKKDTAEKKVSETVVKRGVFDPVPLLTRFARR